MRTPDPEMVELLTRLYEQAKIKIFLKNNGNLLATAQVIIGGIQEINGFTVWQSKFDDNLNIKPPTYDPYHKCSAIWVKDEDIWKNLCKRIEREYLNKKEEEQIEESIEEMEF